MFNPFSGLVHWFESHFGKLADFVRAVLAGVGPLVNLVSPFVAELKMISDSTPDKTALIEKVSAVLGTVETDAAVVAQWAAAAASKDIADLLRDAAVAALGKLSPGAVRSDLNLAVELAYSVLKRSISKLNAAA